MQSGGTLLSTSDELGQLLEVRSIVSQCSTKGEVAASSNSSETIAIVSSGHAALFLAIQSDMDRLASCSRPLFAHLFRVPFLKVCSYTDFKTVATTCLNSFQFLFCPESCFRLLGTPAHYPQQLLCTLECTRLTNDLRST